MRHCRKGETDQLETTLAGLDHRQLVRSVLWSVFTWGMAVTGEQKVEDAGRTGAESSNDKERFS